MRAIADGEFVIESLESEDIARAETLVTKYADLDLGFVDATVIATAERLDATEMLTTDRRHFSTVRPRHVGTFTLSP
jgi:predicted nucleic acid-binding protein